MAKKSNRNRTAYNENVLGMPSRLESAAASSRVASTLESRGRGGTASHNEAVKGSQVGIGSRGSVISARSGTSTENQGVYRDSNGRLHMSAVGQEIASRLSGGGTYSGRSTGRAFNERWVARTRAKG